MSMCSMHQDRLYCVCVCVRVCVIVCVCVFPMYNVPRPCVLCVCVCVCVVCLYVCACICRVHYEHVFACVYSGKGVMHQDHLYYVRGRVVEGGETHTHRGCKLRAESINFHDVCNASV